MSLFLSIGEAMVELSQAPEARADTQPNPLWRLGFAGDTLNTAWYARALLPPSWQVSYLTRLGQDPFSPRLLEFLRQANIDTGYIRLDPQRSVGLYAIELQDGERSFAYWRGQSAARLLADDGALLDEAFAAAQVIYLSGITLAILSEAGREALLSRLIAARAAGKLTVFDPNLRPKLWESPEAMRHWQHRAAEGAQLLLPSFEDEAEWFGDATLQDCAERWYRAGASEVVVKNGGQVMGLRDDAGYQQIEVTMARPLDTTGAGDSFNGGYLAARLQGASAIEAVGQGHAIARQVIAAYGALVPLAQP